MLLHEVDDERKKRTIVGIMLSLLEVWRDISLTDPRSLAENHGFAFVFEDDVQFSDPHWLRKFRSAALAPAASSCGFVWLNAVYPAGEQRVIRQARRFREQRGKQRPPKQQIVPTSFHFHTAEAYAIKPTMATALYEYSYSGLQATDIAIMRYEEDVMGS